MTTLQHHRGQQHPEILRALEEERKQIARELHDQVIQGMIGLYYHLYDIRTSPGADMEDRIAQLQVELRQVLDIARRVCVDLRPPDLCNLGLIAAIHGWTREVERRGACTVDLRVEGGPERHIPEDVALCLFRVLQEALMNVQKHAAARQVVVTLLIGADHVSLTVQDDGKGFRAPRNLSQLLGQQHFGLIGMCERIELVHGVLDIESSPGHGTCIHARIPYPRLKWKRQSSGGASA